MRYLIRVFLLFSICLLLFVEPPCEASSQNSVRIMTLNLWVGGQKGEHPLQHSLALIHKSKADIVGLQETMGRGQKAGPPVNKAAKLADLLKWYFLDQGNETAIISRFPIVSVTPKKWGAAIQLPTGQSLFVFNAHFRNSPYQPYQLTKIPYGGASFITTEAEAIQAARETRGDQVNELLREVRDPLRSGAPIFVVGDFNEPSFQDWTTRAAEAKKCPIKVEFPATKSLVQAGLVDAYRKQHPNEVVHRGNTWTTQVPEHDPNERHDRIDFVFYAGDGVRVKAVNIVGEDRKHADIVVTPYPSDHRAVLATFALSHKRK